MNSLLPIHILSKSGYMRGLQCIKSLHLNKYHPELKDELSDLQKKVFETGHSVGEYAQKLFPGGVNCGFQLTNSGQKSAEQTSKYMSEGAKIIYEAAFQFDKVLVIADIMVKSGNKWKIFEVKSATKVEDQYIDDTSLQYSIISKCGIKIEDISVVYINNQYVKNGDIDVKQLFNIESVLELVKSLQDKVEKRIAEFKNTLASEKTPNEDIGPHCSKPYTCDFTGHCWKHIPEYSVFNLSRIGNKAFELYKSGIVNIEDIPDEIKLSVNQMIEKESYVKNKNIIDKKAVKDFLSSTKYPLYFMDFETIQPAIPIYDNSTPYQQIVFQYSLFYKKSKDAKPEHFEYLADGKSDPRIGFIEQLLKDTEKPGTILAYNVGFEKGRLNEIARDFPKYKKQIEERVPRLVDLMTPFAKRLFYKPEMRSSNSLKSILPALNPKYAYDDLEIQGGGQASDEFIRMMNINDEAEIKKIRENLLKYCERDTYGMIVVLEELEKLA